jgi:hypothetical protein
LNINLKKDAIRLQAGKELQAARDRSFAVQTDYQNRLIELHRIHSNEFVQFAQDSAAALELESTRAVPDAVYLKRQAQYNAKNRDYKTAEALFDASNQARIVQTQKRQEEAKALFRVRKRRIAERQEEEIQFCLRKQHAELEWIGKDFQKKITILKNSLSKAATDMKISLNPNDYAFLNDFQLDPEPEISALRPPARASSGASTPVTSSKQDSGTTPLKPSQSPHI